MQRSLVTWFAALLMTLSVSGCAANTPVTALNCCKFLKPIYLSEGDTTETQDQVIDYLIVYERLCGG